MKTINECKDYILNNKNKLDDDFVDSINKYLCDYERLKGKEDTENTFNNILYDMLGINKDECLSDEALIDILNNDEVSEGTKKEIERLIEKGQKY